MKVSLSLSLSVCWKVESFMENEALVRNVEYLKNKNMFEIVKNERMS